MATAVRGVAQLLSRQDLVCLFQHFFPDGLEGRGMRMAQQLHLRFWSGDGTLFGMGRFSARALFTQSISRSTFCHKTHAEKSGVADCGECHTVREDGTFAGLPAMEKCAGCHSERIGESKAEAILVDSYIKPAHETPWLVYARQPANVWFSHAIHVKRAELSLHGMPFYLRRIRIPFASTR